MKLTVNGRVLETSVSTVRDLLNQLNILPERVAVEVNLSIVKRTDYESFPLQDEDKVEIVNFIGGG